MWGGGGMCVGIGVVRFGAFGAFVCVILLLIVFYYNIGFMICTLLMFMSIYYIKPK